MISRILKDLAIEIPELGAKLEKSQIDFLTEKAEKQLEALKSSFKQVELSRAAKALPQRKSFIQIKLEEHHKKTVSEGRFYWIDADFARNLLETQGVVENQDPRYPLLNSLLAATVHALGASSMSLKGEPQAVQDVAHLSIAELKRKNTLYLAIEKLLSPLSKEAAQAVYKKVQQAALKREFFQAICRPPSSFEVNLDLSIGLLSHDPVLCSKFKCLDQKVGGMEKLKLRLFHEVIYPFCNPETQRRYGIEPLNGILLFGPPGCGKTLICETLAEAIAGSPDRCFKFSMGAQGSFWAHQTARNIEEIFENAKKNSPSVIFIDEVSAVLSDRKNLGLNASFREEEISQFLEQMQGCGKNGVLVVCATNLPQHLDEAALRKGRIDKKFYIPLPDLNSRKDILQRELAKREAKDPTINSLALAHLTEGFIVPDMQAGIQSAFLKASLQHKPVSEQMLAEHLAKVPKSLNRAQLKEWEHLRTAWKDKTESLD